MPIQSQGTKEAYATTLTAPFTYIEPLGIQDGKWIFRKPGYKTNDGIGKSMAL